jgi:hypothetical protein
MQGDLEKNGSAEFTSQSDLAGWKVKAGSEREASSSKLNTLNTACMIAAGRCTYKITEG